MKKVFFWIIPFFILSACSMLPVEVIIDESTPTALVWTATAIQPIETLCPGCGSTATLTPAPIESSATIAAVTEVPLVTQTNTEISNATATAQIVNVVPTGTATATAIPATATIIAANMKYEVQSDSPVYIPNFVHTDAACSWMGIAGQVFNKAGSPLPNVVVVAEGSLNSTPVEVISLTSLSSAYGPGGYELPLSTTSIDSSNSIYVSIYDLAGNLLSSPLPVQTYNNCDKNLIIVNFKEK
jgi:hypothetical protein